MANILIRTLYICYRILDIALLAFCVLSWTARSSQKVYYIYSKLGYYLWPVMAPARWILSKLKLKIPVDFSPWLTMILAGLVYNILARIIVMIF